MDYRVIFKDSSLEDLERIVKSVAAHNPNAARRLGELIIRRGEALGIFPERHPRVRQRPGVRRLVVGNNFKVFYRVNQESRTVEILRCWDGRQGKNPPL